MRIHFLTHILVSSVFCIGFFSIFLFPVYAQNNCQVWNSTNFPPADLPRNQFGMPYNPFNKALTIQANCTNETIHATFGDNDPLTYIYDEVYVYVNGIWHKNTLEATEKRMGKWIVASGTTTFAQPGLRNAIANSDPLFISGFICHWKVNDRLWKCGCDTDVCDQPRWNLQEIIGQPE